MIAALLQIAAMFSVLSLLAFGGGAAVLPDMQRQAVDVHHWLTAREFLDMFALSRAIPPGSMIVVLIGQKAAGILGGLVALLAMFGPSSLLAFVTARLWHRGGGTAWRETLEQALAPVSIGVTIASGIASPAAPSTTGWPTRSPPQPRGAGLHPAAPAGGNGCRRGADRAAGSLRRAPVGKAERVAGAGHRMGSRAPDLAIETCDATSEGPHGDRLGIGIITCNRKEMLAETLARVRTHTTAPVKLVVADDGSSDGTAEMVPSQNIALVTGRNMGIAWNKNRALYLLRPRCSATPHPLEEIHSPPRTAGSSNGCRRPRVGPRNLAGAGSGLLPVRLGDRGGSDRQHDVSAQCSGFSRTALLYGGYFDSRFRGYGQEHVEHTRRMVRVGYGGSYKEIEGEVRPIYKLLKKGSIKVTNPKSYSNQPDRDRNWLICRELLFDEAYRTPWRDDAELAQFRDEMANALREI